MTPREWLLRRAFRAAYPMMRAIWFVTRPRVNGAKCVVLCSDRVLLVRQTYGDRSRWDLPGGGLHPGEDPLEGARRELREETGVDGAELVGVGTVEASMDFRHDVVHCFRCRLPDEADPRLSLDGAEILEARWFPVSGLPAQIGDIARRAVELAVAA
jgi:8-oxo-dGTP pyrophosphatase MutT (NUDIX family)